MRPLPPLPSGRVGVATTTELDACGWTPAARRRALESGRLIRVARGCLAPPPPTSMNRFQRADLDLARRAVAAALPVHRTGVGHLAGAWIRGWPIWATDPHPCVTTCDPRLCRVAGVHLHHTSDTSAFVWHGGMPLTGPARTLVDIAREFGVESALVSGDVALARGDVRRDEVAAAVEAARGRPGVEHARLLPDLLDPLAESPLESRGRHRCHLHGVAPTHSQVWIRTRAGRVLGRVDHFWAEGVIGEADGRIKYDDDPDALSREKWRQQGFEDEELEVVRWSARDLVDFTAAAGRIRRARERARRTLRDGPRTWIATTHDGVLIPPPPG